MIGPLAEYALKSSLVLVTCGAVSWMLRHRSSALRHALWSAALAATIILGPLSAVTPPLKIPLFPRAIAAATTRNHSGGRGTMPAGEAARATLPEHVVSPSRPVHGRSRVDTDSGDLRCRPHRVAHRRDGSARPDADVEGAAEAAPEAGRTDRGPSFPGADRGDRKGYPYDRGGRAVIERQGADPRRLRDPSAGRHAAGRSGFVVEYTPSNRSHA